jgi:phosphate transport system substrate-binding protein
VTSRSRMLFAGAALIPVALAAACGSSSGGSSSSTPKAASSKPATVASAPAKGSQQLSETGSSLLFPLFGTWATGYKSKFSNVAITTASTGSGAGISGATAGTVDIGASDAYLSPGDMQKTPSLKNIPLAISAQQINYNIPGLSPSTHLKLNGTVLAQIYQGKVKTWNDPSIKALNPGASLPATKIVPLRRSDSSGDTFIFTSYLSKQNPAWSSSIGFGTTVSWPTIAGAPAEKGNSGMVTGCKSTPGCIAYIGISYLKKTTAANLGEAQLANGAGAYELPTPASITAAATGFAPSTPPNGAISMINSSASGAYPIINYEYGIVNAKQTTAAKAQTLQAFLHWAITEGNGPTYLNPVQFQPLPSKVQQQSDAQIAQIKG